MGESDLNYRPAGVQQLGEEDANSPFFFSPATFTTKRGLDEEPHQA
jgi:hypothetical protein